MAVQKSLENLMRLLRLHGNQRPSSHLPDIIFVSIDLEVSGSERHASRQDTAYKPHVKELRITTLDSRPLFAPQRRPSEKTPGIVTLQYSTVNSSKDFEACDVTNFQERICTQTIRTHRKSVVPILKRCLRAQETAPDGTTLDTLRPIVLVGHSVKTDLKILESQGLNVASLPVIAIMDMH